MYHDLGFQCKSFFLQINPFSFYLQDILNEIAENCIEIATDKVGCCIMQDCIGTADEETGERLVNTIVAYAPFLSQHSYGLVDPDLHTFLCVHLLNINKNLMGPLGPPWGHQNHISCFLYTKLPGNITYNQYLR